MMKKYDKYKSSNITWIGNIPEHWMLTKTKFCSSFRMGQTILKEELIEDGEYPVFSATEGDHYFGRTNNPSFILEVGDIVIPARGNSIGHIALVHEAAVSTQTTIANFINKQKINSHYLFYFYKGFRKNLFHYDNTAIPQITVDQVKQNPVLLPTFEEQRQIVKYLDHQTAIIDQLIHQKEKLIELLKDKRRAVIHEAVTKGLNPNAKMKYSGIEWLSEVPEHWRISTVRYSSKRVATGKTPPTEIVDYYNRGDIDWYGPGDFQTLSLNESQKKITSKAIKELGLEIYPANSILLIGIGATLGKVGLISKPSYSNQQINAIVFKENISPEYGLFFLDSIKERIVAEANSSTMPILNQAKTKDLIFLIPPYSEQIQIAQTINKMVYKIESLNSSILIQIEKLKEYRQSIISEAVTGKIDVRDWQPNKQQVA